MIPKIIHCCWFGKNPIPDKLLEYMSSWKIHCPEYEIKIWNEENFDIDSHPFTKSAYALKKYAFVSDFVRAYALLNFGGIYLDTDVELKRSLNPLLDNEAFSGFEKEGLPFTAVWGAIPNHSLTQKVLKYYDNRTYSINQEVNTLSVSKLIIEDYKIDPKKNNVQIGSDGVNTLTIYPAEYLCLDIPPNFATHHFFGSWVDARQDILYKEYLHTAYHVSKSLETTVKIENNILKALANTLSLKQLTVAFTFKIYYIFKSLRKK